MARTLIGKRIRDHRRARGMTQAALAATVGISASYLNLIEGNRRNIGGALLKRIADALAVPIDEFDGAAERRLIDDLGELAADAAVASLRLSPASAADLAAQFPDWARALVALHRSNLDAQRSVAALSDRLTQDPFLGDAVHGLLTHLTAIRSAAEILESDHALDAAQRRRFVAIVAGDSRRMSDVARALAAFFGAAHAASRSITPADEVDDFIIENDDHFPRLEAAADALRAALLPSAQALRDADLVDYLARVHAVRVAATADADGACGPTRLDRAGGRLVLADELPVPTRRFQLARAAVELACGDAVAAELDATTLLKSPAARRRAREALLSYAACALLLPYDEFMAAAAALRYDIDALAHRFGASVEQVCQRLVSLRRPGAEAIRFGLMRVDPAGYVSKRFPLPRLPLPRYGNACPLWAVYGAARAPNRVTRQLVEFPDAERYLMLARTVEKGSPRFDRPRHFMSIMLVCSALQADQTVYGDGLDLSSAAPAVPVGPNCRVCVRRDCAYREEDPIIDAGSV